MKKLCPICIVFWLLLFTGYFAQEFALPKDRDTIHAVSSKDAFLFATAPAEQFAKYTRYTAPLVESLADEKLFSAFCAGRGFKHPDMLFISRRITAEEFATCRAHDIATVVEIQLGNLGDPARPVYIYFKGAQLGLIPGMYSFLRECLSMESSGAGGYLTKFGLVPLAPEIRIAEAQKAVLAHPLTIDALSPH